MRKKNEKNFLDWRNERKYICQFVLSKEENYYFDCSLCKAKIGEPVQLRGSNYDIQPAVWEMKSVII